MRGKANSGRGSCCLSPYGTWGWSLRSKALQQSRTMHYSERSGAEACEAKLTAVADLAIFRLTGPGAGACEAKHPEVADHAMCYSVGSGAEACEAKLTAVADHAMYYSPFGTRSWSLRSKASRSRGSLHVLLCRIRRSSLRSKANSGRGSCHVLLCGIRS